MSERLEALKRWVNRGGTEKVDVSLDEDSAARLRALAGGRESPEVLSFLASSIVEDVLKAEDYESRVSESKEHPAVGDLAPDAKVLTRAGDTILLSSRWGDGPAALIFLRHYG